MRTKADLDAEVDAEAVQLNMIETQRQHEAHVVANRRTIICNDSTGTLFTKGMSRDDQDLLCRMLVRTGKASWLVSDADLMALGLNRL